MGSWAGRLRIFFPSLRRKLTMTPCIKDYSGPKKINLQSDYDKIYWTQST